MKWPQLRRVDLAIEFMGSVTKEMEKHKTNIRRGRLKIHRDQAMVKRYNRTLAKRLFGHQYGVEMQPPESRRYSEWVVRLPVLVSALSGEVTRFTGKKTRCGRPSKKKPFIPNPLLLITDLLVCGKKWLPSDTAVRYLYQPGKLKGGGKRATDPIWSLKV